MLGLDIVPEVLLASMFDSIRFFFKEQWHYSKCLFQPKVLFCWLLSGMGLFLNRCPAAKAPSTDR
jgi:hypothetical protein